MIYEHLYLWKVTIHEYCRDPAENSEVDDGDYHQHIRIVEAHTLHDAVSLFSLLTTRRQIVKVKKMGMVSIRSR